MIHKTQDITISVDHAETDQPDFTSVYFNRPIGFSFDAGDWIDIGYKNKQLQGGRTYSISSSPTESEIRISFRNGVSQFKNALQTAQRGDDLTISQYGNDYDFQFNKNQSSLLLAGGVGIAPFRSMLKEMFDNNERNEVTLIYLNQDADFLFQSELDLWSNSMPNFKIHYISTKQINRKKREKLITSLITTTNQNFYISGPPAMVESNEHLLIDLGIKVRDIRIDSFGGY